MDYASPSLDLLNSLALYAVGGAVLAFAYTAIRGSHNRKELAGKLALNLLGGTLMGTCCGYVEVHKQPTQFDPALVAFVGATFWVTILALLTKGVGSFVKAYIKVALKEQSDHDDHEKG